MMKKTLVILAVLAGTIMGGCKDYLDTSSPANAEDEFVTTTPSEAFKVLSWCYANYRQNAAVPLYWWNDPVGSDIEMYPEANSTNNLNAKMRAEEMPIDAMKGPFDQLYATSARAKRLSDVLAEKTAYQNDVANGQTTDWTQIYGEAVAIRAWCYFMLIKHYGDVPYDYENSYVEDYTLSSRFAIYDQLIADLQAVEPLMYSLGEGGITAERMSRTFVHALIGEIALYAGGYQTIRTDMPDLYGSVQFETKGSEAHGSVYARRTDYKKYYEIAEEYFGKAIEQSGSARLIETDDRSFTDNPFQRHFQYMHDLQVSPESIFEVGNMQGGQAGQTTTSEFPYAFGRPSNGGSSNAAPNKSFSGIRFIPTFYYGAFEEGDRRRDVSAAVTGSNGDGNEAMIRFVPGSKLDGGIALNKWDENRMNPPYTASQRLSGINYPVLRIADLILMQAEVKAVLGDDAGALELVNQIRMRAFGDQDHQLVGLSGDALLDAIWQERKLELAGEGTRRWDMVRSGKFSEEAMAVRAEMKVMIDDLRSKGYHTFANGNTIPAYIYTKMVRLDNPLIFESTDKNDPTGYPGWRGQYDWTKTTSKVNGTDHNVAIKGLFTYIDPESAEAAELLKEGYVKTNWGIDLVTNEPAYRDNILSGIKSADEPPRYFFAIPFETINKSKGAISNGYGLPQQ